MRAHALPFALALLAALACDAHAQSAAPDTSLEAYIRRLADSTDAYYGASTAEADTAGMDSVLASFLANPRKDPVPMGGRALQFGPFLHFDRADGGVFGLSASAGRLRGAGRLGGTLAWANGPDEWRGGGEWTKRFARAGGSDAWNARAWGGRTSVGFDRDAYDPVRASLRAFVFGSDHDDWLRRDGWLASLERETPVWRAGATWRDMLESPLATEATWTLFGGRAVRRANEAAWLGRVRELELAGSARVPRTPQTIDARYATSGGATGSDFTYRRLRVATGGEYNLSRHLVFAPQLEYGRLRGEAVQQAAFFLGGRSSLRSLPENALTGTGKVFGRAELVMADDFAALFHTEPVFPLTMHVGVFASSGAVWGRDDAGSVADHAGHPAVTARDWPRSGDWLSEAGVSVMWRPGLPDPEMFLKAEYAIPIGRDAREARWEVSFQRTLNLLRPFE